MKTGKLAAILIAITFLFVAVISCVMLFSVKEVRVDYSVSDQIDLSSTSKKLDSFVGKSFVFLNVDDVKNSVSDPLLEVVSVDKQFPNVINVEIKQRREVYKFNHDGNVYTTDENGFVFHSQIDDGSDFSDRQTIKLNFEKVNLERVEVGSNLSTSDNELLKNIFEMAKAIDLTDRVKEITVVNTTLDGNEDYVVMRSAEFQTYTGVKVVIENAYEYGVERVVAAFNAYDEATDYVKTFDVIKVVRITETGQIKVIFTSGYNQNED